MVSATNVNPPVEDIEKTSTETSTEAQVVPAPIPKVNVWQVKQSVQGNTILGTFDAETSGTIGLLLSNGLFFVM